MSLRARKKICGRSNPVFKVNAEQNKYFIIIVEFCYGGNSYCIVTLYINFLNIYITAQFYNTGQGSIFQKLRVEVFELRGLTSREALFLSLLLLKECLLRS